MGPDGWEKVRFAWDCEPCEFCLEEPWCPKHEVHFANCLCIGPTQDDTEYMEVDGVLYGRVMGKPFSKYAGKHAGEKEGKE
jgi:hypothetical protein